MDTDAQKGLSFVENVRKFSEQDDVKSGVVAVRIIGENVKLVGMTSMNPKGQVVVISAVTIRKAMHAAGFSTKDETLKCLIAVTKLGSTLALGAAAAPATFGVSAYLAIVMAAVEGYEVGNSCFVQNGMVSHALKWD